MGLASFPDGRALVAPQEGEWTPASMIIEALEGENYGFGGFRAPKGASGKHIDLPLCYVPRGIDNSTGGMLVIDRESWGPLNGAIYCFSYGAGTHYYVLQDNSGPRPQGAVVPLDGAFSSGAVRAAFNPTDDHIYVVGTEGWGNYATTDGSFNRVRYTGEPMHRPIAYQSFANGIRVEFEDVLDPFVAENAGNYLAQQWNYEYADRYGSPEFSIDRPDQLGHDLLTILSVQVLPDARSIFVEIPELKPASQVYLRMHLRTATGTPFKTDLFPTIKYLGPPFTAEHLAPPVVGKPEQLSPRVRTSVAKKAKRPTRIDKADRHITLKALTGLRYDQLKIHAVAGEKLAISLKNDDLAMQHNWVLVQPDAYVAVGEASFKMLSDPAAAEKNYVPDLPSIIAAIPLVDPRKPGRYPFLCTFPGHWQAMKGMLIVERK
jgi:azurin